VTDVGHDREGGGHGGHDHTDEGSHDDDSHHHHHASGPWEVAVLVITSSRDGGKDESGERARAAFEADGHEVVETAIVPDDEAAIREAVESRVGAVDAIISTGGTGVTPDDVTIDAVGPLLDPELPGIGEYFRRLSHEQIGTAAMLSRATGGVVADTAVYAFPGSPDAVELGVERVVLPELDHVLGLARR
jgi:molybdenum cofactor biosynthesis protein B